MTAHDDIDTVDRLIMILSGGLLVVALPLMGLANTVAGSETPLYTYQMTESGETTTGHVIAPSLAPEGAEIVAAPLFDPTLRAWLVAAALMVLGLYAGYRMAVPRLERTERGRLTTAD